MEIVELKPFLRRTAVIVEAASRASRLINDRIAPEFNVTTLFDPNEVRLSRVIAFLLNPDATHGQGFAFLIKLLEQLEFPHRPVQKLGAFSIRVEDHLGSVHGRADIHLEYQLDNNTKMRLLIENKPWANEGNEQIPRYVRKMNQDTSPWAIIFMPPNDRKPSSIDSNKLKLLIDQGKFYILPYFREGVRAYSIISWIKNCINACNADAPRRFLNDFKVFLENKFSNERVNEVDYTENASANIAIFDFLLESDDDFKAAFFIEKTMNEMPEHIRSAIFTLLKSEISKALGDEWISVITDAENVKDSESRGIKFKKIGWPKGPSADGFGDLQVAFEFNKKMTKFTFGVNGGPKDALNIKTRRHIIESVVNDTFNLKATDGVWLAEKDYFGDIPADWSCQSASTFKRLADFHKRLKRDRALQDRIVAEFTSLCHEVDRVVQIENGLVPNNI